MVLILGENPVEIVILDTGVEIARNKCMVWTANIETGHSCNGMGCGGGSGAWGARK